MTLNAPYEIYLPPKEFGQAKEVGKRRYFESRGSQRNNNHGLESASIETDEKAAVAEAGFQWGLGLLPINLRMNNFKEPDVGKLIQIRNTVPRLIIRDDDKDCEYFVQMQVKDNHCWILGWIKGETAKLYPLTDVNNGRPPAWFILTKKLNKDLTELLRLGL